MMSFEYPWRRRRSSGITHLLGRSVSVEAWGVEFLVTMADEDINDLLAVRKGVHASIGVGFTKFRDTLEQSIDINHEHWWTGKDTTHTYERYRSHLNWWMEVKQVNRETCRWALLLYRKINTVDSDFLSESMRSKCALSVSRTKIQWLGSYVLIDSRSRGIKRISSRPPGLADMLLP